MADRFLDDRRTGLEEAFFARQNEELRRRIVEAAAKDEDRHALAEASHIDDTGVLDRLLELGIRAETLSALTLVPLVLVAWEDGDLSDFERQAVLDAAAKEGIHPRSPGYALLRDWLRSKPGPNLKAVWKDYVGALAKPLDLTARRELEHHVMDQARKVADLTGGLLGLTSRISAVESVLLSELSAAFHP